MLCYGPPKTGQVTSDGANADDQMKRGKVSCTNQVAAQNILDTAGVATLSSKSSDGAVGEPKSVTQCGGDIFAIQCSRVRKSNPPCAPRGPALSKCGNKWEKKPTTAAAIPLACANLVNLGLVDANGTRPQPVGVPVPAANKSCAVPKIGAG
jgi:hypothetical protein